MMKFVKNLKSPQMISCLLNELDLEIGLFYVHTDGTRVVRELDCERLEYYHFWESLQKELQRLAIN